MVFGVNVPLPLVVHVPLDVDETPFKITTALLAQTVWLTPAAIAGGLEYTMVTVSETGLQLPLFSEVSINCTLPAVVSAVLGV